MSFRPQGIAPPEPSAFSEQVHFRTSLVFRKAGGHLPPHGFAAQRGRGLLEDVEAHACGTPGGGRSACA